MPELPDLQAFSRNLTKQLAGKKLKKLTIPWTKKLKSPASDFSRTFEKQTLIKVERVGKELFFRFESGDVLAIHMMLHGNLYWFKERHEQKYPILELLFADGTGVVMTDFQGQAVPTLNPSLEDVPDALSKEINFRFLKSRLQGRKTIIKNVLLDQKIMKGIGNAYADEILWDARLSPFSVSSAIPDDKIKQLAKSIKGVLTKAEKQILKTNPDIITGEVRDFLAVHNKKRSVSPAGGKIKVEVKGGRKTYYTDEQQEY